MRNPVVVSVRRHTHALFLLGAVTIYVVSRSVAAHASRADVLEIAATIDLVLTVPVLYYLLLVRGRGVPGITVLPVFLAGLLLAPIALPEGREATLHLMRHLAAPAELVLLAVLVRKVLRARASYRGAEATDVLERLRTAARELAGPTRAADVIAYEAALLWYALFSWRSAPEVPSTGVAFSYHRRSGYGGVVAALLIALVVEIVPVHVLVGLWSGTAAWVLTGLSVYGLLWLIGDYRAMRLRPVVVTEDELVLRTGLRWSLRAPLHDIETAEAGRGGSLPRHEVDLATALLASPRVVVRFREPVEARGIYGIRRRARTVTIGVDEPERLVRLLQERRQAADPLKR